MHGIAACALLVLLAAPARAQDEDGEEKPAAEETAQVPPAKFLEGERLTGDWGGRRTGLEEEGLRFEGSFLTDFTRIQSGGPRPHEQADRWWLSLGAEWDLRFLGEGPTLGAAYWQMGGEVGSRDLRAAQDMSVYESPVRRELAKLYLRQSLDGGWTGKVGRLDATDDFASPTEGADFLNTGVTFPTNLLAMPVYPDPGSGAVLGWMPEEERGPRAGLGLFDGALHEGVPTALRSGSNLFCPPRGLYGIAEAGWAWDRGGRPGRAALGAWTHTGDFRSHGVRTKDGTTGVYALAEGRVWNATEAEGGDGPGLSLVLRATDTQEGIGTVERAYAAAAVWTGPLPSRGEDALGVAFLCADLADPPRRGLPHGSERVGEAYYRVQALPSLSLEPDIQWFGHPGGRRGGALVLGFRAVVDF